MKRLLLIFLIVLVAAPPITSFAQLSASSAASEAIAAYARARSKDAANVPTRSEANSISAGASTGTKSQTIYNWLEGFVRTTLKTQLLDKIVDQIVAFIQGNGSGKPQFVTDWRTFMEESVQSTAGDFVQSLGLGFLCEPFSLQLQLALLPVPKNFADKAQCTLDQIVGNARNFYNDFSQGGWLAYGESWKPQNNFFGAFVMAAQQLELQKEAAAIAKVNEAVSNAGYLSIKGKDGKIITPGSTARDLVAKAVTKDIEFIMTAEQLQEYAATIANALVNRVVKEGLAKVGGPEDDGGRAERLYEDIISSNFSSIKGFALGQLDLSIGPRQEASPVMESSINALQQFISNLNSIHNSFNNLSNSTCPAPPGQFGIIIVSQYKQLILDEINSASATFVSIQNDISLNNSVIAQLTELKSRVEPIENTNEGYIQLIEIQKEVANVADPTGADIFLEGAQSQQSAISQNINQKLSQFNQQLQICEGTTP